MSDQPMEQRMIRGAVILTVTSFIVKILSAVYRVPFQNLVGDEGFYVYQQIYPIYGIAMTLALSGLPVYLSKLVASETTVKGKEAIVTQFFKWVSTVSIACFLLLYVGSTLLASLMGDRELAPLIKVISFVFLLVPFLSSYRGYYQGEMDMLPTSTSQLVEQGIRVLVILGAGYVFIQWPMTVYQMGSLAMSGAVVGGLAAVCVLIGYQLKRKNVLRLMPAWQSPYEKRFGRKLLVEGGTLCVFSAYLVLFQLVDSFTVKQYLVFSGMGDLSAKVAKGVFDRGQPMAQLGLVIAVAMTATFMPALTTYFVEGKQRLYQETAISYLKVSAMIATATGVGLALVLPYMNVTLFNDNKGEVTLVFFVLSVIAASMIQTYQTIYQSQSKVSFQFVAAVLGLFIKSILAPLLTYYLGTVGSSLSTIIGLSGCWFILRYYLSKEQGYLVTGKVYLLKLSFSICLMITVLGLYRYCLEQVAWSSYGRGMSFVITLVGVAIGFVSFLTGVIRLKLLTKNEWQMLPLGKKITKRYYKKGGNET